MNDEDSKKRKDHKERKENKDKKHKKQKIDDNLIANDQLTVTNDDCNSDEEKKRQKKAAKKAKKAAKREAESLSDLKNNQNHISQEHNRMNEILSINNKQNQVYSYYKINKNVINMTESEVVSYRNELGIQFFPEDESLRYKPLKSFDYLHDSLIGKCDYVMKYITSKNFKTPSPIQSQCWPPLLDGRDCIGIAATGSGKTLGLLIPGLLLLAVNPPSNKNSQSGRPIPMPRMLIMAPTRELAMQSFQVTEEINGPKAVCIYGGVPKDIQISALRNGADIVIATPGRLLDLLEAHTCSLQNVLYAVLDEADRMLDEGFMPSIRQILSLCPPKRDSNTKSDIMTRQTVMFSATWPEEVRKLAEAFLADNSIRVLVGSDELSANHRVTQIVEVLGDTSYPLRDRKLLELLEKYHKSRKNRCLLFVLYKKEAVALHRVLQSKGFKVTSIHGDKSQVERFAALNEFKDGSCPLMIATDVAARGLDIPQVEYVINYSFPLTVEDYVHRIGKNRI